jgi:hypothetical protein
MAGTSATLVQPDLVVVAFGTGKTDLHSRMYGLRLRIGKRSVDHHAATSSTGVESAALCIIQSAACWALLAAVKIARLSAFSTRKIECIGRDPHGVQWRVPGVRT